MQRIHLHKPLSVIRGRKEIRSFIVVKHTCEVVIVFGFSGTLSFIIYNLETQRLQLLLVEKFREFFATDQKDVFRNGVYGICHVSWCLWFFWESVLPVQSTTFLVRATTKNWITLTIAVNWAHCPDWSVPRVQLK